MQIAMVGLGRMGANMVRRLMRGGHECVVFDRRPASVDHLASEGASGVGSLEDLATSLAPPRAVWVMVPAGEPTEEVVRALARLSGTGGHHHRWRKQLLQGRHPAREPSPQARY